HTLHEHRRRLWPRTSSQRCSRSVRLPWLPLHTSIETQNSVLLSSRSYLLFGRFSGKHNEYTPSGHRQASRRGGSAEESKVKLKTRPPPSLTLEKKSATRVIRFGHAVFRDHAPPQSGEGSLLRWFWSSAGASGTVPAQPMLPLCWGCFPSRLGPAPSPPFLRDKSKVHRAPACLSRALRKS